MPRPVWKGSVAFGLVSIPVGLYSAVQEHRARFNQLQRGTSNRIRYKRVNEMSGEEVPYEEIVRGFPLGSGRYVVIEDDELAAAAPKASRTIELLDFVGGAEIDPMLYATPYYLAPQGDAARRPYALLLAALEQSGRVGIAKFVLREREHLCAIRPAGKALMLETMHFADELRAAPEELEGIDDLEPRGRELEIAVSLVDSMTGTWQPEQYRDEFRDRLEELVERKRRGEELTVEEEAPVRASNVVDLVSVLSRSVDEARRRREQGTSSSRRRSSPPDEPGGVAPGATPSGTGRKRAAAPSERSKAAAPTVELADLGRAELYERAKALDIPKRSAMSREELLRAVSEASPASSGRATARRGRKAS